MSNPNGRFGVHGGQYVPETLMNAIIELEEAYNHYKAAPLPHHRARLSVRHLKRDQAADT